MVESGLDFREMGHFKPSFLFRPSIFFILFIEKYIVSYFTGAISMREIHKMLYSNPSEYYSHWHEILCNLLNCDLFMKLK